MTKYSAFVIDVNAVFGLSQRIPAYVDAYGYEAKDQKQKEMSSIGKEELTCTR